MAAIKEKAVTEILFCIKEGKKYSETFAVLNSKMQIKDRTFANYWKVAIERHRQDEEARRIKLADQVAIADNNAIKSGIIDREGRLRILGDMANGLPQIRKSKDGKEIEVFPSIKEQQTAIDMLTRMGEGYTIAGKPSRFAFGLDTEEVYE